MGVWEGVGWGCVWTWVGVGVSGGVYGCGCGRCVCGGGGVWVGVRVGVGECGCTCGGKYVCVEVSGMVVVCSSTSQPTAHANCSIHSTPETLTLLPLPDPLTTLHSSQHHWYVSGVGRCLSTWRCVGVRCLSLDISCNVIRNQRSCTTAGQAPLAFTALVISCTVCIPVYSGCVWRWSCSRDRLRDWSL